MENEKIIAPMDFVKKITVMWTSQLALALALQEADEERQLQIAQYAARVFMKLYPTHESMVEHLRFMLTLARGQEGKVMNYDDATWEQVADVIEGSLGKIERAIHEAS